MGKSEFFIPATRILQASSEDLELIPNHDIPSSTMIITCQPGYEVLLACETDAYETHVGWVSAEATADDLCFAHLCLPSPVRMSGSGINAQAEALCDFFLDTMREHRFENPWPLVFRAAHEPAGLSKRATNIEKEFRKRLKRKAARLDKLATGELPRGHGERFGLCVFVADYEQLHASTTFVHGGQRRMADDSRAPSRSYLKIEEACAVLNVHPKEGESVVDLGAAPGGWSYSAAKHGAMVTAVDNGPLKGGAVDHPLITHLRADAFRFRPEPGQIFDWLFCDLVEEPHHVMELIAEWLENGWCRHIIANLKFGRADAIRLIQDIRRKTVFDRILIRHLFHDREEITLMGKRGVA